MTVRVPDTLLVRELGVQFEAPGYRSQQGPYRRGSIQESSGGFARWRGTLTFEQINTKLSRDAQVREQRAFFTAIQGGAEEIIIPLSRFQHNLDERFPTHTETSDTTVVRYLSKSPTSVTATQIGLGAQMTLDTSAGFGTGLRKGDWCSLHSSSDPEASYYGTYACHNNQAGTEVVVGPAPPELPDGFSSLVVLVRRAVLRVRMTGAPPVILYGGNWVQPVTFNWVQA